MYDYMYIITLGKVVPHMQEHRGGAKIVYSLKNLVHHFSLVLRSHSICCVVGGLQLKQYLTRSLATDPPLVTVI